MTLGNEMQTNTQHTPGPWVATLANGGEWNIAGVGENDWAIALVMGSAGFEGPNGRSDADARLIAAAPDLLEALRVLHALVGVMFGSGPDAVIPETVQAPLGVPVKIGSIMADADAAIAKAVQS